MAEDYQRTLLILYGSQTGCVLETAQRVQREARLYHFRAKLLPMDSFDHVSSI
jgi:sulfite reductase alpha subunit-like flavoprotein